MSGPWKTVTGGAGGLRVYSTSDPLGAATRRDPVLVLCHDLPRQANGSADIARTLPTLADRLAEDSGWRTVTATLRGAGSSQGNFSATGWLDDLGTVIDDEVGDDGEVWLVGFGLGGALSLRRAATDSRVRGVACLGTADDLTVWAANPDALVARCRASGVITDPAFPADVAAWVAELVALRPVEAATALGDRPLLVVHGSQDPDVPTAAARALVDAADRDAELRIVYGAGHWLRADPRVVATLSGWVERRH